MVHMKKKRFKLKYYLLQKKYRQNADRIKFTSVADSPDILHAKNSYMQCSEVGDLQYEPILLLSCCYADNGYLNTNKV